MNLFLHPWNRMRTIWVYRHEPENMRILADAYWSALLVFSALAFVGLVAYSGVKFYEIYEEGEEAPILSSVGGIMLNREELRSTIEVFDARKSRYESFKKNLPKIDDPSR